MSRERLTIDLTVARDYLAVDDERRRERHEQAVLLFALFRAGEVELAIAPQGHRLDAEGDLAEQLRAMLVDEGVEEAPQLAYVSEVTYPAENLYPGQYVDGFADAWDDIVATWRSHGGKPPKLADRFYVETHVLERRDVFLTDDRPLLVMCRRLREEHGAAIEAMSPSDYLARRSLDRPGGEPNA